MRLILLALAAALFAGSAHADVTLNLKDAEINTLISTVSEVTGKNFIVDPRVKGKVTVISAAPMDKKAVYDTFLAVLQVQGFAAVPAGSAIKIIPETNARSDAGVVNRSGSGLPLDDIVTHVFTMQNISAAQLVPILRPLVPQWGHLAAYPGNNMLIISDRAGNVARLAELITKLDNGGDRDIESVQLENAAAAEVVRILTTMIQQNKQADPTASSATVIADERSNAVLVGGDKSERARVISIIQRLDTPLKDNDGATQVVYLRYASAENLAPILEGYAQQSSSAAGAGAASTPAAAGGSSGGGFEKTRVLADKDNNALVITAPPKTMRQIRNVISQLDIQRKQVLVQAIIAEVSTSRMSELGLDFAVFDPKYGGTASILNDSTIGALSSAASLGSNSVSPLTAASALLSQGLNLGGGVISNDGKSGTSFGILLKALRSDGDTNVLSTPTLTSLDNEESEVSVGQEVPFLSGSFSNTGSSSSNGSVNPFQTIERKDVGLKLGVTPQINEGDTVKLKIKLESSSVASGGAGSANLVTNKRTITNTVNVESGQVLVIGGLTDDKLNDGVSGVPLLSSIPVVGNLFKSRSVRKEKSNLMVFIHPTILRNQEDGDFYTQRKYDSVRDVQVKAAARGKVPLIGGPRPVMPDLEAYVRDNSQPPPPPSAAPQASPMPAPAATPQPTPIPPPAESPKATAPAPAAPAPAPAQTTDRSKLPSNVMVIPAQRPGEPARPASSP